MKGGRDSGRRWRKNEKKKKKKTLSKKEKTKKIYNTKIRNKSREKI